MEKLLKWLEARIAEEESVSRAHAIMGMGLSSQAEKVASARRVAYKNVERWVKANLGAINKEPDKTEALLLDIAEEVRRAGEQFKSHSPTVGLGIGVVADSIKRAIKEGSIRSTCKTTTQAALWPGQYYKCVNGTNTVYMKLENGIVDLRCSRYHISTDLLAGQMVIVTDKDGNPL